MLARILILLCLGSGVCFAQQLAPSPASPHATVYVAHDPNAVKDYRTNPAIVRAMVDRLVIAVTGRPDVASAWRSLVAPNDRVGIKISAAGGELFTTHRDVVRAIVDGLVAAGLERSSIIVWDRSIDGAAAAGYRPESDGYQLRSIPPRDGYDPKAVLSAPILGKLVWGDLDFRSDKGTIPLLSDSEQMSSDSHFCRLVSTEVSKIINVPVMSDSTTNGIAGCLYNVTVPNVDNWRRFTQTTGFAASGIPEIYSDPVISGKVVLNIMDGLVAEYAGGPAPQPNYAVHFGTLYASKDPVAIDAVALRQLEQWRKRSNFPPIGELATHVKVAAQMGLGDADPAAITLKSVSR